MFQTRVHFRFGLVAAGRIFSVAAGCIFSLAAAHAASKYPADFIMEPKYLMGLEVLADLELEQRYNDNIQAQAEDTKADFISIARPALQITKYLGRHQFTLEGQGGIQRFWKYTDENVETGRAGFSGNVEALRILQFPFSVSYGKEAQRRVNRSSSSLTIKPQDLYRFTTTAGVVYQPNRLKLELIGNYEEFRADDAVRTDGTRIFGKDRDKDTAEGIAKISYALGTGWTPYLKFVYGAENDLFRTYTPTGFNGVARDNKNYEAQIGFDVDYKNLLIGGAAVGYQVRDYTKDGIDNVDALSLDADLKYNITEATSIGLLASRKANEDNEIMTSFVETGGYVYLSHILSSRWLAEISAGYSDTQFKETNRQDDEYQAGVSVVYLIDKGLALEGSYRHQNRDSTVDTLTYDQNIFWLNLKKRF